MRAGAVVAAGPPGQVLTADLVEQVYGLPCLIVDDPVSETSLVVPASGQWRRTGPAAS